MDCSIADFLVNSLSDTSRGWGNVAAHRTSNLIAPAELLGEHLELLRGDANALWAEWFAQSISGNDILAKRREGYGYLISELRTQAHAALVGMEKESINSLVRVVADLVTSGAILGEGDVRTPISKTIKEILVDSSGDVPRCYLCGHQFSDAYVDSFLGVKHPPSACLAFVDFLTPRGISPRDLDIEVEHVVPHSRGGTDEIDNLRLCCKWCNSRKQDKQLCYEAPPKGNTINHPKLGSVTIPHSFWLIRILGVGSGCSYPSCDHNSTNSELHVTQRIPLRKLNPLCLTIRCPEHDPISAADRLVHRAIIESKAQKKQRGSKRKPCR